MCLAHDMILLVRLGGIASQCVWHDSFMCVACFVHVCGMTHLCVWRDSFIRVAWLIHLGGMGQ